MRENAQRNGSSVLSSGKCRNPGDCGIENMNTSLESVPMAGPLLSCVRGKASLPERLPPSGLIEALEKVGVGLNVYLQ